MTGAAALFWECPSSGPKEATKADIAGNALYPLSWNVRPILCALRRWAAENRKREKEEAAEFVVIPERKNACNEAEKYIATPAGVRICIEVIMIAEGSMAVFRNWRCHFRVKTASVSLNTTGNLVKIQA